VQQGLQLRFATLGMCLALLQAPALVLAQQRGADRAAQGLTKLQEAVVAGKSEEARKRANELLAWRLAPWQIGSVQLLLAELDGKEGNSAGVREHLERAIESGGLSDAQLDDARYGIVQTWFSEERWQEGIGAWKEWERLAAAPPSAAAYAMLALAYDRLHELELALTTARKSVELAKKPAVLELLQAIHIERGEYTDAAVVLKTLIGIEPHEKGHWVQLAAIDDQLGDPAGATASFSLAYAAGLLTDASDLRSLSVLLLQNGIPYRAGRILSQAVESGVMTPDVSMYSLLASCWIQAREYDRAIDPLARGAMLAADGELYVRLAEVYAQAEDWSQVAAALGRAIEKGKLRSPGNAEVLLGIALYNLGRFDEARIWLERARSHVDARGAADDWLRQMDGNAGGAPQTRLQGLGCSEVPCPRTNAEAAKM
jgi:tetratricopeptide (TPR) repeat protein